MRGWRLLILAVVTAALVWQMRTGRPPRPLYPIRNTPPAGLDAGPDFDPARCGTVSGVVRWQGNRPVVEPISLAQVNNPPGGKAELPNPNAPRISDAGEVADTIVLLHLVGVDFRRSKAWDVPPVTVEVTRLGLVARQGSIDSRCAIVRRGAELELYSREANALHSIRGRGAAFFTQMLPVRDRPVLRTMPEDGFVELSSGSGYFWLRGYLVVSGHPYIAVTGTDGRFRLDQVPDGEYEVVCWKPNWHVDRLERDPEWLAPARMFFRAPVVRRARVAVRAGQVSQVDFTLSAVDFAP